LQSWYRNRVPGLQTGLKTDFCKTATTDRRSDCPERLGRLRTFLKVRFYSI
jgi:hypothetical protein